MYICYKNSETPQNYTRYYLNEMADIVNHDDFDFNRKTVLYFHGWIEDFESESSQTVAQAYIERGDHNIIMGDWGRYSFSEYFLVIPRFTQIARIVGRMVFEMVESGLDVDTLHCVGHRYDVLIMINENMNY